MPGGELRLVLCGETILSRPALQVKCRRLVPDLEVLHLELGQGLALRWATNTLPGLSSVLREPDWSGYFD